MESNRSVPGLGAGPGHRAAEAYIRPYPISTVGSIASYVFDLRKCEFSLKLRATETATDDRHPTTVFLPEYHFPRDQCTVAVSSGKWEISFDEEEGVLLQKLRWWHAEGEQSLRVTGMVRRYNLVEGAAEEGGYYEQLNQLANNCVVM